MIALRMKLSDIVRSGTVFTPITHSKRFYFYTFCTEENGAFVLHAVFIGKNASPQNKVSEHVNQFHSELIMA